MAELNQGGAGATRQSLKAARRTNRGYAVVTGASSGIGRELARVLAGDGWDLIAIARDEAALQELRREVDADSAGSRTVHLLHLDLSEEGAEDRLVERLQELGIAPKVLVNNAGLGDYGPLSGADPERLRKMIAVNITALTLLTRAVLPGLLDRGEGRILNVASVASFQPGPFMAVYYATKAYVLSFSESLAEEVSGTGVTVTAYCPGPTASNFHDRARIRSGAMSRRMPSSRSVAQAAYRAMMRGDGVKIHGAIFGLMVFVERFLPRKWLARLMRRVQEARR